MPDHVHMLIAIPPKYAVSQVIGYHQREERDPPGAGVRRAQAQFCGAALSGREGTSCRRWAETRTVIREYIRKQEQEDKRLDQLNLWD